MTNVELQGELPPGISLAEICLAAELICSKERPQIDFEISLMLVDSESMRHYNRTYRGVDQATDVLSFEGESIVLGQSETRLCDIIIDTNQVSKQKGFKTFREEFWFVLIHALLHITGFDHIRQADKNKMEDAEDNYRKQILGGRIG